jgi:4-amino-4-deoxy-L-arabinose transferase-like glycosyltransferase
VSIARRAPVVGVTLAAAALRASTLGVQSFWLDEATTARLMRLSLGAMLRGVARGESTPPAYYIVAWLWSRAFGSGEVGLRSLSALAGTLTVPLIYAATARIADRRAALAAAALAAFSPLLIWYSQEARSYALLVLLCTAALWALPVAEARGGRWLWAWAGCCALALATHYFAVFFVVPQALWLLWRLRRASTVTAVAAPAIVGAALLPLALHQHDRGNAHFISDSPLGTRVLQVPKQLLIGYAAPGQTALVAIAALIVLGGLALAWRSVDRRARALLALAVLTAAAPLLLVAAGFDYLLTRNVIAAWIPAALAFSLVATRRRWGGPALAGLCALGLAATVGIDSDAHYQRDDWRDAARAVPSGRPTAIVATPASARVPLEYFLPRVRALPAAQVRASGIIVIALGTRATGAGVTAPTPPPLPAVAGFGPPRLERHPTFDVVRYTALVPAGVLTAPALAALKLQNVSPALLFSP